MSEHTILAKHPVYFVPSGCVDQERADVEMEIKYEYKKGAAEASPTFDHGGLPAEPAEVFLLSVRLIDGDGIEPMDHSQLQNWAMDYLDSETGYEKAVANAEDWGDMSSDDWEDDDDDYGYLDDSDID